MSYVVQRTIATASDETLDRPEQGDTVFWREAGENG